MRNGKLKYISTKLGVRPEENQIQAQFASSSQSLKFDKIGLNFKLNTMEIFENKKYDSLFSKNIKEEMVRCFNKVQLRLSYQGIRKLICLSFFAKIYFCK